MGAYQHISLLYQNLEDKARSYNYPESSICVLSGNEEKLKANYPQTYSNLHTCYYIKDGRSYIEYGQDLVASWLVEDSIMHDLANAGVSISLAGNDKCREILRNKDVSANSDYIISGINSQRHLELICDYTGWWVRKSSAEVRDDKFPKMLSQHSLILGISTRSNLYMILDTEKDIEYTQIDSHKNYKGKSVYSLKLPKGTLKEFIISNIARELNSYLD